MNDPFQISWAVCLVGRTQWAKCLIRKTQRKKKKWMMIHNLSIVRKGHQGMINPTQWRRLHLLGWTTQRNSQCRLPKQERVCLMKWVSKSQLWERAASASVRRSRSRRSLTVSMWWSGWPCLLFTLFSLMIFELLPLGRTKTMYFSRCRWLRSFSSFSKSCSQVILFLATFVHSSSGLTSLPLFQSSQTLGGFGILCLANSLAPTQLLA